MKDLEMDTKEQVAVNMCGFDRARNDSYDRRRTEVEVKEKGSRMVRKQVSRNLQR